MNNPVLIILTTTNWGFVIAAVICSSLIGMLWYSPALFGNLYGKLIGVDMNKITDEEKKAGMMTSMPRELVSRVLYFIGLGYALQISGWTSLSMSLLFAFVVWLVFVFPANMSQTARSNYSMKMLWLIAGNTLITTLLATTIWFFFFS